MRKMNKSEKKLAARQEGKKHLLKLKGKTAVFIDYANLKAWARKHKFFLDLRALYSFLVNLGIFKIFFYYGNDLKNPLSFSFLNKLRTFGFEIITKDVKYIKVNLLELLQKPVNQELLKRLSFSTRKTLINEVRKLEEKNIKLLSPKANFDVEITLDMVLFSSQFDTFCLFSGDSDFAATLKYLRSLGKKVIVVADKKFLAGELYKNSDLVIFLNDLIKEIPTFIIKKPRTNRGRIVKRV